MRKLNFLVIALIGLGAITSLSSCDSRTRRAAQADKVLARKIKLDSVRRLVEPKVVVFDEAVISQSLGETHNIMSFLYKSDTITITYEHYDVWNAYGNPAKGEDGKMHDVHLGYYVPKRLINIAKDQSR